MTNDQLNLGELEEELSKEIGIDGICVEYVRRNGEISADYSNEFYLKAPQRIHALIEKVKALQSCLEIELKLKRDLFEENKKLRYENHRFREALKHYTTQGDGEIARKALSIVWG